jgi:hypothetical protein
MKNLVSDIKIKDEKKFSVKDLVKILSKRNLQDTESKYFLDILKDRSDLNRVDLLFIKELENRTTVISKKHQLSYDFCGNLPNKTIQTIKDILKEATDSVLKSKEFHTSYANFYFKQIVANEEFYEEKEIEFACNYLYDILDPIHKKNQNDLLLQMVNKLKKI